MALFGTRFTPAAALGAVLLAGCGGGSGSAPALGSGITTHIRALDLIQSSPQLTVQAGSLGNPVGSIGTFQATAYAAESGGTTGIRFFDSSGALATFNGTLLDSTYDTVAIYAMSGGGYGTFSLVDDAGPIPSFDGQIRVANAVSVLNDNFNIYLTAGAHTLAQTAPANLITPNGLPLGQSTPYEIRTAGSYTVTVVSSLDQLTLVTNQVVTLAKGKAITLWIVNGNVTTTTVDNG